MTKKHLRVLLGVPSGNTVNAKFMVSLVSLMVRFNMVQVPGYGSQEMRLMNVRGSILSKSRLELVRAAVREQADYLLMIDSDHTFPADLLHRLIAAGKPVVAINCTVKQLPSQPTARAQEPGNLNGIPIYTDPETTGVEQVWRVGTGVMLISRRVLEQLPASAWDMVYREDVDAVQGEDWSFCAACEKLAIPLFIDHDASKLVGHEGSFIFTHDHVGVFA